MLGTRKLLHMLIPEMEKHEIKMGRDLLYDLLRFHGLLIRRRRRMVKTTDSHHWLRKYPNLIAHLSLSAPEQLWVSDITYIRTLEGFSYLSLITDVYSRKIVGYALHPSLEAVGCIAALEMAVDSRTRIPPFILIHHSDRGIQYCSQNYTALLNEDRIAISMTQSGSPYENALAERVNGIIKNEFFPKKVYQNHKEAKKSISVIIGNYNEQRPHASLNYHHQIRHMVCPVKSGSVGRAIRALKKGRRKVRLLAFETVPAKRKKEAKKEKRIRIWKTEGVSHILIRANEISV
ncbi:IS3 family transposase [Mucilaginibacter sp. 3215]|uniref:IS3 family transposase n=1 Tax=Mucilaginibacter sp. 3215 TaxID=3373912 RepID=UPI003D1C2F1F